MHTLWVGINVDPGTGDSLSQYFIAYVTVSFHTSPWWIILSTYAYNCISTLTRSTPVFGSDHCDTKNISICNRLLWKWVPGPWSSGPLFIPIMLVNSKNTVPYRHVLLVGIIDHYNFYGDLRDYFEVGKLQVIMYCHGHLGQGNRIIVPSCAVWKIRDHYPTLDGQYMGFYPHAFNRQCQCHDPVPCIMYKHVV